MGKKDISKDIVKVEGVPQLPAYMQSDGVAGLEDLAQFVIPPRIKIVQKQARQELLDLFAPGDVILSPANAVIIEQIRDNKGRIKEDSVAQFNIVPLFFYAEWATLNPIELRGSESMIRYRTTDPTDPIVQKARNENLREEPHPEDVKLSIRHVEFLNFIVQLVDHPLEGTPALLSFAKGEWIAGSNWASLIKMRNAPLYGSVFTATVALRPGKFGEWYGLNMTNPYTRVPWVSEEEYAKFKALHEEFVEHHRVSRLKANLEEDPTTEAETQTTGEF